MSTATLSPSADLPRLDWPFLIAAVLGAAALVALVALDGQPASAALILGGFALGVAFLKTEFSFTAAWRRFLVNGEAGGLLAALLLIAVASVVIVPVAALVPGFGGAIAPIGPSLIIGAFVFGIGMQLANGCGSGTLYTAGGGSGRMLITLALFIVGSVIGSLHLPAFLRARWRRSDPRFGLFRPVGRTGGDARQHRGGCARHRDWLRAPAARISSRAR